MRQGGEEFLFPLEGKRDLHFEHGTVFRLSPGDGLYFDSAAG